MNSKPSYDHPREIDVCCGRGKGIWSHPGNVKFQEIIAQNIHRYTSASSRNEKSVVIISVVEIMRQRGARFVKRDDETGLWHAVGEYQAREKTAHAIRDHLAKMARRRSQEARQAKQKSEQEKNESGGDGSKSQIDSSMSKQSNKGPASSKGGKTASARRNHKDTEQKRPNKSSDNKPSLAMSSNLAAGIEMGRQQSGKSVVESLGMDAAMSATGSSPRIKEVPSSSVTTASVPASNGRLTSISKESVMTSQLTSQQSQMVTDPNAVKGFLLPTYTPAEVQPGWGFTGEEGTSKQAADASMNATSTKGNDKSSSFQNNGKTKQDNLGIIEIGNKQVDEILNDFEISLDDLHPTPLREDCVSPQYERQPEGGINNPAAYEPGIRGDTSELGGTTFQTPYSLATIQHWNTLTSGGHQGIGQSTIPSSLGIHNPYLHAMQTSFQFPQIYGNNMRMINTTSFGNTPSHQQTGGSQPHLNQNIMTNPSFQPLGLQPFNRMQGFGIPSNNDFTPSESTDNQQASLGEEIEHFLSRTSDDDG